MNSTSTLIPGEWVRDLSDAVLGAAVQGWTPTVKPSIDGMHVTDHWPLAQLETALSIVLAYLIFVAVGMLVMPLLNPVSDRVLYPIKFVYNIVQVFLCAYMALEAGILAYRNGFDFLPYAKSAPFDAVNPPVAKLLWLFYLSKLLDFVDTVTIVLQKRWGQLSFLHVYHHSSVFLFYWLNLRRGYDGDIYLTILLNAGIHTVMYTYYFVSMHTKDIWWKKYLTLMQITQFCIMMTQAACMMTNGDSTFPPVMTKAYFWYILSMLSLFVHFYVQSYTKNSKPKKAESKVDKVA